MIIIEGLFYSGVFTLGLSGLLYIAKKETRFREMPERVNQLLIGVLFGLMAVFSSRSGMVTGGVTINIRDAAPLCAGLLFGGRAGILAGLIGGLDRYFFAYGDYTRIACSLATVISGFVAAFLRNVLFDRKHPSWLYGFAVGVVFEILHMLLVMIIGMKDMATAFQVVQVCSIPMCLVAGVTVMLSCLVAEIINGEVGERKKHRKHLTFTFQFRLLICVLIAFAMTCAFTSTAQSRIAIRDARQTLLLNVEDIWEEEKKAGDHPETILDDVSTWRVGMEGGIVVCNEDLEIISDRRKGETLDAIGIQQNLKEQEEDEIFQSRVFGTQSYVMYEKRDGYYNFSYVPVDEIMLYRNVSVYITVFTEVLIFSIMFCMIDRLMKKLVVSNIKKVNDSLAKITAGDLEEHVDVRSFAEFADLSDDINLTVSKLRDFIAEAATRLDRELEFARTIQHSALPSVFPPYPDRHDFEIYATMNTAKEVGGDFYDFYMLGDFKLCFLMADVSGKGIPAAMFMMRAKTIIKSLAETGIPVEQVFTKANEKLCENNEAEMFVTAWMGILDTRTGHVDFVNAGHNPPLIRHGNGGFTYFKTRPGFILAGMEDFQYKKGELQLKPGDTLFLYTDGVTEAMNEKEELYGDAALQNVLSDAGQISMEELCRDVKRDVDRFAGTTPQFDDMTMMALRWRGDENMKEMTIAATIENIEPVTDFVNEELESLGCSMKAQAQIDIAIDELFGNIAHYAYDPKVGPATVRVEVTENPLAVLITFIDHGVPYDPLAKMDPDVTQSLEDREIGGLGIYMVKNTMDDIVYEYQNGQNILKIKKNLE